MTCQEGVMDYRGDAETFLMRISLFDEEHFHSGALHLYKDILKIPELTVI